jgi:4-amino-4-deoxychorismate lyase
MYYYLNGKFIAQADCFIDSQDRGILLGEGLFETIYVNNGVACFLSSHFTRLYQSACVLNLSLSCDYAQFEMAICKLIKINKVDSGGIRVTLTGGCGKRGLLKSGNKPTLLMHYFLYMRQNQAISLSFSPVIRNQYSPIIQHKTTNYLELIIARQKAHDAGGDDAILTNLDGKITETTTANLFIIKQNSVMTAPVEDGLLPGIIRHQVLNTCKKLSIAYKECSISKAMLYECDAAFVTNSLIGVQKIERIEDVNLPSHPIINQLSAIF